MDQSGWIAVAIAVLAAIPPTLVAYAAFLTGRANAKKADALIVKSDEIHVLANNQLSAVTSQLAIANEKIAGLEKLVVSVVSGGQRPQTPPSPTPQ